jgi:hypothetical protein
MYRPYVIFGWLMVIFGVAGLTPFLRYAVLEATGDGGGHLQSLLVGTVLLVCSFLSVIVGIVSDLLRTNRALIEDTLEHTKKMRFGMLSPADAAPIDVAERAVRRPKARAG